MRYELAKERISKIEDKSRGNLKDRKKNEEKLTESQRNMRYQLTRQQ